jgi:hypothetical protein
MTDVFQSMSIEELAGHIQRLDAAIPICTGLIRRIYPRNETSTSSSIKKGWLGWLAKYHETDARRRKDGDRDAKFVYNRLSKVVMLLWLAESAGVPRDLLEKASSSVPKDALESTRSAHLRRIIPWKVVEAALAGKADPAVDAASPSRWPRARARRG